jgi:hypothetical protein
VAPSTPARSQFNRDAIPALRELFAAAGEGLRCTPRRPSLTKSACA